MLKIGYRTVKTAVGTALAIYIAQLLNLEFYVSAGILVILCVKPTKKRSFQSAWERFLACLLGMFFAGVFFELIGYHPISLGLLLLLFIPTTVALKITEGIVTSSVIILHLYTVGDLSLSLIMNELLIIAIGIGLALTINLYMPSMENELKKLQLDVERNFKYIFIEFAGFLEKRESEWDGKEILEVAALIERAAGLALKNIENHMLRHEDEYYHYFKMREKQLEILERVMPIISSLDQTYIQGKEIAHFLRELSEGVHSGNTAKIYLEKLEELKEQFRQSPLPKDRKEFETRSALFYFVNEMEQYLLIKRYFKRSDV
ncbi:aromatic acid exporter family protein [Bacillus taeanensis]|uniref:Aromatic acid exporter family protein n=1 Tax=Bacillus taeanensis TaxID=273032 RepID=A0A366XW52_9BACI|nr:aromatic acid exporter family protein [Bacillus taeanensis]RBW70630.1 aromatic acid exporter family protein [Bacillus taeanensis]